MEAEITASVRTALVALAALLPITNPPGNAPIFHHRLTTNRDEIGSLFRLFLRELDRGNGRPPS